MPVKLVRNSMAMKRDVHAVALLVEQRRIALRIFATNRPIGPIR